MLLMLKIEVVMVEMKAEKLVLGLTGMPGAGKSLVARVAKENGYAVIVMGDVIRGEAKKRKLKLTRKNIAELMLELRQMKGNCIIAKKCIPKIENVKNVKVLVDGIRSLNEVEEFKRYFQRFSLMAVHASPETRFKRVCRRVRSDDPLSWEFFFERDMSELNTGLGNAIAMAGYMILNEEKQKVVRDRIKKVLRNVEEKWMK